MKRISAACIKSQAQTIFSWGGISKISSFQIFVLFVNTTDTQGSSVLLPAEGGCLEAWADFEGSWLGLYGHSLAFGREGNGGVNLVGALLSLIL